MTRVGKYVELAINYAISTCMQEAFVGHKLESLTDPVGLEAPLEVALGLHLFTHVAGLALEDSDGRIMRGADLAFCMTDIAAAAVLLSNHVT